MRPNALFANMSGQTIALTTRLDGAFERASFAYTLAARRFAFDRTGFEDARASGRGRLTGAWPWILPVRFTAQRVTGIGDVAGYPAPPVGGGQFAHHAARDRRAGVGAALRQAGGQAGAAHRPDQWAL
ncbi:hypothetical protein P0F65_11820 [Sphingomonas sp. I4]